MFMKAELPSMDSGSKNDRFQSIDERRGFHAGEHDRRLVFVNLDQHAPPRSVDTCLVIIITRKLLIYGTKTRVVRDIFNCHASHSKD
jgi:hypothetical protein